MKPSRFMISVQWGKGMHYFTTGARDLLSAINKAEKHKELLRKQQQDRKHKPPPPIVRVWELRWEQGLTSSTGTQAPSACTSNQE
jgi:hypothetical protein